MQGISPLNLQELRALVERGESEKLEFKRSTSELEAGMRTATGFLNSGVGGHILLGVNNDGRIPGMDVSDRTLQNVANGIHLIEPAAGIRVEQILVSERGTVIALVVPSSDRVHTYRGVPYQRVANTTGRMQQGAFERRMVEQAHRSERWEALPAVGCTIADLDHEEIRRTVNEAVRRQRLPDLETQDLAELLLGLGLTENGNILNAAMVLFGRGDRLMTRYPQCMLRLGRFRGTTKNEFIDNRQVTENAFELYQRAQKFWIEHLPVAGRVVPELFERIDDPLYPPEALREALANALCHRDYSVRGGAIDIAIYDDRLELTSTGPLRFGLVTDDLRRPHQSLKWNPLIAQVFYLRGIIETWGRGTLRMIELTRQAGLAEPEFEASMQSFTVRFRPSRYIAPTRVETDLSDVQQKILQVIGAGTSLSLGQIMELLGSGPTERAVQENLRTLRTIELVEMTGTRRWARWRLKRPQT